MQASENTSNQRMDATVTRNEHITIIGELANQAADANLFGLQDVCLLIAEALSEQTDLTADLNLALQDFPALVIAYLQQIPAAANSIIKTLRHPDLNLSLVDEEFDMLTQALIDDSGQTDTIDTIDDDNLALDHDFFQACDHTDSTPETTDTNRQLLDQHLTAIEYYANQAAADSQYGLQDVCLLILDTVNEQHPDPSPELLTALSQIPSLIADYKNQPNSGIENLLHFLQQPPLAIALADDEWSMLQGLLLEGGPSDETPDQSQEPVTPEADLITPPQSVNLEIVDLLVMEAQLIATLLTDAPPNESLSSHLERLDEELERYTNAANIANFTGLAHICDHVRSNIDSFKQNPDLLTQEHHQLLQGWIGQISHYLANFTETSASLELIAQLNDPLWPVALSADNALSILEQLRTASCYENDVPSAERQQIATDADVSLTLPDDVNQELLDILLQELPSYTQEFSEAIHHLQQGGNNEDLNIAQRLAHTLKGSANTVGIHGIAVLTHHLEDILEACAKANKLPNRTLISMLIDAADCLESMSDFLMGQGNEAPANARQVLQEVLDWANQIDQNGLPDHTDTQANATQSELIDQLARTLPSPTADAKSTASQNQQSTAIRVPSEQIDTLLRMSGESLILNSQANERLRRIKTQLLAMDVQFKTLQRLSDELEQLIDIKDLTSHTLKNAAQPEFDSLEMDQYNELYTTSRRLVEAAFDAQEMNLDARNELEQMNEVLEYQQRLVIDTQSVIMQTRLVPVATISSRLQRTLRQTCRLTGKNSDLQISGEHLMIDSDVLNSIIDPLMHILRNAIDHGLESEAERLAVGKSPIGTISIHFDREGNNILVRCQDDGRGLDFSAIRQSAIKRGLIQPDQDVSEDELKRFILRPNFSTRTESTQTSGRGVGMNAVHFQVLSLGGSLALDSVPGQGLTVELSMPLPISRSHALLVMAGSYRVAITSKGLKQILYAVPDNFIQVGDELVLNLDDVTYPLTTLNKLLRVSENRKKTQRSNAVLLVQQDEKISAVLLDSITDSLDIVIKDFGHYIKKIPGYIGAAILGDGAVAPVLDVPELLRLSAETSYTAVEPVATLDPTALLPKVLVVDDSLSQRRSLEQLLSDAGFAVYIARDGMEAVELLADVTPDIMLTDLEMPRMNGIELTAHIRTQTRLKSLPIIMITSRTTQKHHKLAEEAGVDFYIAKPVREDDLLSKIQFLLESTAMPQLA